MMRQEGKKDKATKRRVNVSKKSVMALSTNSALRAAADVGDKCQLHLITPTLYTAAYISYNQNFDYTHPMPLPSPNFIQ